MIIRWSKKTSIWLLAAVAVVVLVFALAAYLGLFSPKKDDPYKSIASQQTESEVYEQKNSEADDSSTESDSDVNNSSGTESPEALPALDTVSSIVVTQMGIEVYYVKGIEGFEYTIERTAGGTEYVQFSNSRLVGTKCTGDVGAFASIVKNPTETENATTIVKKVNVNGNTYGLSLVGSNCTADQPLLSSYQKSFQDAFGLIKEL